MTEPLSLIDVRAHRNRIGAAIDERVARVIEHGRWVMGPEVDEFEAAATAFVDPDRRAGVDSIGCSNGTDALMLALQALGLEAGQAVVCPSFTFVATAEAVAMLGGVPVFCDVGQDGFNISAGTARLAAEEAVASGLTVAGFIAVDLFGVPADYAELARVAADHDAWLVADGAQSFGASRSGRRVGSLCPITTTSFFPAKPLGCYGDGGMVFTTERELAATLRSLRAHGMGTDRYDNVRIGQNSRLDTLQAAILLPKLSILDDELAARDRIAARYCEGLDGIVDVPRLPDGARSAWAQFTVATDRRDALRAHLDDQRIGSAVYYPKPLHRQDGYRRFHLAPVGMERTDWLAGRVVSLPMHPYLTDDQVERVIEEVKLGVK